MRREERETEMIRMCSQDCLTIQTPLHVARYIRTPEGKVSVTMTIDSSPS